MNGSPTRDTLEIEAADFGPIVEAKVDLRPLTVFVGPSNTGKSYLAILVYALHRHFNGGVGPVRRLFRGSRPVFQNLRGQKMSRAVIDSLNELAQSILDHPESPDETGIVLPFPLADEIRSGFDAQGRAVGREIGRCFGIDKTGGLVRKGQKTGGRIRLRRRDSNGSVPVEHVLSLQTRTTELKTTIPEKMSIRIDATHVDEIDELVRRINAEGNESEQQEFDVWRLMGVLNDLVLPHVAGPLHLPAYYLPADRTGVMHAHSVVVAP